MPDTAFVGVNGQTIAREKLALYLNVGTADSAEWAPVGDYVSDSSMSMDWSMNSEVDIRGNTHTTMKKPVITQTFDPMPLVVGGKVHEYLWNRSVKEHDAQAMSALDMLVVHLYAGTSAFAERYSTCAWNVTGLGGEGGGNISMPGEVTLGGTRTTGTASVAANGTVTFTADT